MHISYFCKTQGVGYVPHDGMPNVFMATAMDTFDIGEGYPGGIHPRWAQSIIWIDIATV